MHVQANSAALVPQAKLEILVTILLSHLHDIQHHCRPRFEHNGRSNIPGIDPAIDDNQPIPCLLVTNASTTNLGAEIRNS